MNRWKTKLQSQEFEKLKTLKNPLYFDVLKHSFKHDNNHNLLINENL